MSVDTDRISLQRPLRLCHHTLKHIKHIKPLNLSQTHKPQLKAYQTKSTYSTSNNLTLIIPD